MRIDVIFIVICGVFLVFVLSLLLQIAEDEEIARKSTKDDEEDEFLLDY